MKKFIYIFVDIVFFNLSVFLLYYLGLINNTNLIIFGNWFDIVFSNIVVLLFLWGYTMIYSKFFMDFFSYWKIALVGGLTGCILLMIFPIISFQEALFIVLYTSFSFTFLSYSIYFDNIKIEVFK